MRKPTSGRPSGTWENAVRKDGWDGEWFLRAYDAFGHKVGSRECTEGQIFIEPQGMCTMAGIGGPDYGEKGHGLHPEIPAG